MTDHNIVAARTHSWEARPTVLVDRPAALQPAVSFDMIQHKKYERGRSPVRVEKKTYEYRKGKYHEHEKSARAVLVPQGKVLTE